MRRPSDNFVGVRLVAAVMVLLGHLMDAYGVVGTQIAHLGLLMLFSISGYLVAGSWRADPRLGPFLARRFLRIWPAYAVMVVICTAWVFPADPARAALFVRNLWFDFRPVGINGSIWMLAIEVGPYVLLALAGTPGVAALVGLGAATVLMTWHFGFGWVDFGVYFVFGLLLQAYPGMRRYTWAALTGGAIAFSFGQWELGFVVAIPAVTVWLGTRSWVALSQAARFGDLSYGVFLWHGPVIHFVVEPSRLGLAGGLLLTLGTSLLLGLLSWHAVERHALQLKPARHPVPPTAPGCVP